MSKDTSLDDNMIEYLNQKTSEAKSKTEIKKNKAAIGAVVRNTLFADSIGELFQKYPFPKAVPYSGKKDKKTERILNLMLSDLHYGSDLDYHETGYHFGTVEESRRTAAVVLAAADWKRQYRNETILYVHLLGDLIQGKLHDAQSAAPLTEQFYRAVWNLSQALRFLASEFKSVHVRTSPGNHGRHKDRHPVRAVNQKWDSVENQIYGALKIALANTPNIQIDIPLTPYYVYDAFGLRGFMTHGDTVLNVGYPNKSINVEQMRRQINEINNKEKANLYGVGHVHVASTTRLPNNVVLLTNGCLIPSDEYAQSIGILQTACCQQIWESVPGIIMGHKMDILIDEKTDQEKDLDKIVKPFPGSHEFGK